jgi:hypothetical protein
VGVVLSFKPKREPPVREGTSIEELLQWSFAGSSYTETAAGWAFSDERDARMLQRFFEAFGIVERSGMRGDPFELWHSLYHEFRDDVLRIVRKTGRLRPYRTDTERQYLTAVAQGNTLEAAGLAWTLQIGTPEWLRQDSMQRWQR